MRVIFLTHNYPRHAGDLPGAFLHPLAVALRRSGTDVRVVAPADAGRAGTGTLDGVPVRRVRYAPAAWERYAYTGRMMSALRDPRGWLALLGMGRALRRGARAEAAGAQGPVVVHAHWWFPSGWAAPTGVPLVVTLHGSDAVLLERSAAARLLGRRVLARARVVTVVSPSLAASVSRTTGLSIAPAAIQPMPAEVHLYQASAGGGGVVTVARLTAQKRLHLLVDAAAGLAREGRPVAVTIVGDGPERGPLEQLVARHGLSGQVRFTGRLGGQEVSRLLGQADLFVLPARAEGYGLAAAEALMSGVPAVVCADGGGLRDLVPAHGAGRHCAPTAEALAEAMRQLLDDPGARSAAQQAGEGLRRQLAPEAVAQRALAWYREAIAAR